MKSLQVNVARPVVIAVMAAATWLGAGLAGTTAAGRQPAPSVSYTLLDGQRGGIEQLRGQVVLVNFWATSCSACVAEMPQVIATHQRFRKQGFDTVAVAVRHDPPALVAQFAESRQLPFGVAIDNTGELARRFGDVDATPTTFLLDKRGRIVKRYVGTPDFAALNRLIDDLLAEA